MRMVDALNALGVLRFDQRRFTESVTLYLESLKIIEIDLDSQHETLASALNNLATSYLKLGRLQEAAVTDERAIAIAGKALGKDHPNYGFLLRNYAVVLRGLGRRREAKDVEAHSKNIESAYRRRIGADSVITIPALLSKHNNEKQSK